jgi:hypothetical protein
VSLKPDHWRYRFARKVYAYRHWVWPVAPIAILALILTRDARWFGLMLAAITVIALLLSKLGCWRCHFNVMRPYEGPESPADGDNWTGLKPWDMTDVPDRCPRCDATIISSPSVRLKSVQ